MEASCACTADIAIRISIDVAAVCFIVTNVVCGGEKENKFAVFSLSGASTRSDDSITLLPCV